MKKTFILFGVSVLQLIFLLPHINAQGLSIPFEEKFDDTEIVVPALPTDWIAEDVNGDGKEWKTTNSSNLVNSAPNALHIGSSSSGSNDWLFSPKITFVAGKTYKISLYAKTAFNPMWLRVYLGTDATVGSMGEDPILDLGENYTTVNGPYVLEETTFTVSSTGEFVIGFHCTNSQNYSSLYIDDISIIELAQPDVAITEIVEPSDIIYIGQHDIKATIMNVGATTLTSLEINYTIGQTTEIFSWNGTLEQGNSETITIVEDFDFSTEGPLEIKLEVDLAEDSNPENNKLSKIINVISRKTIPFTENFDGSDIIIPALPVGWTYLDLNKDRQVWSTENSVQYIHSSPNSLAISGGVNIAKSDWLFTPEIEMHTGKTYKLSFYVRTRNYSEKMSVHIGTSPTVEAMGEPIYDLGQFIINEAYELKEIIFTVPENNNYLLGFYSYSDSNSDILYLDDISITELTAPDIAIVNITDPADIIYTEKHPIKATIENVGGTTITALDIEYKVGEKSPAVYEWTGSLKPGESENITIANEYDFDTTGQIIINLNAQLTDDIYTDNNTASKTINVHAPKTIPYSEDFESSIPPALPELWTIQDFIGSSKWQTTNTAYKSGSNSLAIETNNPRDDWAFTPKIALEEGKRYNLTFWNKSRLNNQVENLKVYIGTVASADEMSELLVDLPSITSDQFQETNQEFTVTESGSYILAFHALTGRNGVFIDDLSVTEVITLPDAGITAITKPATIVEEGALSVVEVTIKNFSETETLTSAKVAYTINDGTPVEQEWTGELQPEATTTFSFPEISFNEVGEWEIKAYTFLPNGKEDANIYNDSLTYTITVTPKPLPDAGITAITKPATVIDEGISSVVEVTIKNFSETETLTSAKVAYTINDGTPVEQEWTGELQPEATTTFSFPEISFNEVGEWEIKAYTSLPNGEKDANTDNDSFSTTITVMAKPGINGNSMDENSVYPNPFSQEIFIDNELIERVSITNVTGHRILDIKLNGKKSIETSELVNGIYFIHLIEANGKETIHKIIKK